MAPLSLCVIARDAAPLLPGCLNSARGLVDDLVVVVDDRTVDDTADIAARSGARVSTRHFADFASQKNFTASQAKNDWILSLDADERVSPELAAEIKTALASPRYAAYAIPRLNYIFGRPLRHTNWDPQTDTHVWLYDRRRASFQGAVHEQVVVSGSVGRLSHPKLHVNYTTVESFIRKLNQYTSYEAARRKFFWPLVFIYPLWKFIRHYVIFLGFLDGWHGLFLSYLQSLYGLVVCVKAWEKKPNSS